LVFTEHTGFNLSIVAKPSEATPLNVNFGLDRTLGSVVPPIHENTHFGPRLSVVGQAKTPDNRQTHHLLELARR
jgi:hypothetical protein